jgi:hypothetical protein
MSIAAFSRLPRENEMAQWQFNQDDQQRWRWTRVEENREPTQSARTFSTPLDCYLDAVRQAVDAKRPSAPATRDTALLGTVQEESPPLDAYLDAVRNAADGRQAITEATGAALTGQAQSQPH